MSSSRTRDNALGVLEVRQSIDAKAMCDVMKELGIIAIDGGKDSLSMVAI